MRSQGYCSRTWGTGGQIEVWVDPPPTPPSLHSRLILTRSWRAPAENPSRRENVPRQPGDIKHRQMLRSLPARDAPLKTDGVFIRRGLAARPNKRRVTPPPEKHALTHTHKKTPHKNKKHKGGEVQLKTRGPCYLASARQSPRILTLLRLSKSTSFIGFLKTFLLPP